MTTEDEVNREIIERQGKDYINLSKSCQLDYGKALIDSLSWKATDSVLDIGCGTGGLTKYTAINKVPEGRVTAFDPDTQRVKIAKEQFGEIQNISFHEGKVVDFLRGKENQYDVIYSNVVLHWIPKEERLSTFQAIYTAAKPGGIIAHQYCEFLPYFVDGMMPMLTDEDKSNVFSMLQFITSKEMDNLVSECGFEVISRETIFHDTKFKDAEEYFLYSQATFHGRIPFYKRFCEKKEDVEIGIRIQEDGSVLKRSDPVRIVLKKPAN